MTPYRVLPPAPFTSYRSALDAAGGDALAAARRMQPEAILDALEASGLKGRGGAGFPAATKWRGVLEQGQGERVVVCNAAEGEPATFKDRMLLRRNPYAVLQGLLIAAHVLDASQIYLGLKRRYAREVEAVREALASMRAAGALTDAGPEVLLVEGPDAYLLGEENALMNVIEGGEPLPRIDRGPVYEQGVRATAARPRATLMHNAETLARIPAILLHGPEGFRAIGTASTPGPVLYTFTGDVRRPGVYEDDPSTSFRRLVRRHTGGAPGDHRLKAALAGASHGLLSSGRFDVPADEASLESAGAGLGAAGFQLLDETRSIPAAVQAVLRFLSVESCSQCPPCKEGLTAAWRSMRDLREDIGDGVDHLRRARWRAEEAPTNNRCALPEQGRSLLRSAHAQFPHELADLAQVGAVDATEFQLHKLEDYDEAGGVFVLDDQHARKRPDWTWEGTPPADAPRHGPMRPRVFSV